jgi:hypothetical protein
MNEIVRVKVSAEATIAAAGLIFAAVPALASAVPALAGLEFEESSRTSAQWCDGRDRADRIIGACSGGEGVRVLLPQRIERHVPGQKGTPF